MGMFSDALSDLSSAPSAPAPQSGGDSRFGAALSDLSPSPADVESYIRDAATKRSIDPEIALKVYRSEGGAGYVGDKGSSFGPFQLHYGGVASGGNAVSGLGDTFTSQTGLDARNPATWRQQVDFSLDQARSGGWGPWHGWKGDQWAGIQDHTYGPTYGGPTGAPRVDVAITGTAPVQGDLPALAIQGVGGIAEGIQNLPGTIPRIAALAGQGIDYLLGPEAQKEDAQKAALAASIQRNMPSVTNLLPQPQTPTEQYARTIGNFLPGAAAAPGSASRLITQGVVPAVTSETMGQAFQGTPYEAPARVGGAVVGGFRGGVPEAAEAAIPTAKQLLETGGQQIEAAGKTATKTFSPGTMAQLVSNIQDTLQSSNSRRFSDPLTWRALKELKNETTVSGIQQVRSLLGEMGQKNHGAESRAVKIAQDEIDKFLQNASPEAAATLEEGRANYAAGSRAKQSDVREQIAELRAARRGGGNAASISAAQTVLAPVVEKWIKGEKNGISPDEFKAMYDIVHGTPASRLLKGAAMVSPERGGFAGTFVGLEALREFGPKVAAVIAAFGAAASRISNTMTINQLDRLGELIRKRSPMYQKAVQDAAARYGSAMDNFTANPSGKTLTLALVASRNMAAGLRKDGVNISSGDLLRQVSGPVQGAADEQQSQ